MDNDDHNGAMDDTREVIMHTNTTLQEFESAGVAALVRAGEAKQWFFGHFGAAMISGARLLGDPDLPGPAALALSKKLHGLIDTHRDWYSPLAEPGTTVAGVGVGVAVGVEPILVVLRRSAAVLRTSGHPTIYMTAALYALARQPALATARVVAALVDLHEAARDDDPARFYGQADYFTFVDRELAKPAPSPTKDEATSAVRTAFGALDHLVADQQVDGRHYFFTGEKIHLITHLHAIETLEALGHSEIAAAARRAQQSLCRLLENSKVIPGSSCEPATSTPDQAEFWEQDTVDPAHVIKLAEAVMALLPRLPVTEREGARGNLARIWSLIGIR
jgi:hypothetical protein